MRVTNNKISPNVLKQLNEVAALKEIVDLKKGHYSKAFLLKNDNDKVIRFRLYKDQNGLTAFFESNKIKHSPFQTKNTIVIFDTVLKLSLKIDKDTIDRELENEINFNLSKEQKELLSLGHEVTLEVNKTQQTKRPHNNGTSFLLSKKTVLFHKSFVADYTFFLGQTSLLLKEVDIHKKLSLIPKY